MNLARGVRDPIGFLSSLVEQYGEIVTVRKGKTYLVVAPEGVQRVLQENHLNYEKGPLYRHALRPLMGDGLFVAEGEAWRRQRRMAQPAFSKSSHAFFAQVIVGEYAEMRERWLKAALAGHPVNLRDEMMSMTLRIAFRLTFSDNLDGRRVEELITAFLAAEQEMNIARAFFPVHLPEWVPTPSSLRFRRAMNVLEDFIYGVIRSRRQSNVAREDLLGMYLNYRFEGTNEKLDDVALRDELLTILAAGQSVTDGLCWTFHLLTEHPKVAKRIQEEALAVIGTSLPTLQHLESLPYTTMAFKESLRLYPPAWGFMRIPSRDDFICGYPIASGSRIIVCPYLTHRLPSVWQDPERFDPERFSPERSGGRHKFAWYPFGEGPRKCIGAGLAILESQLLLPIVYQAFDLAAVPGPPIRPVTRISMKQNRALELQLRPRPEFLRSLA